MSLFGTSPTEGDALSTPNRQRGRGGAGLFDDDTHPPAGGGGLFNDAEHHGEQGNGSAADSPWDMPTPRKHQSRAELIRRLLPASDVPDIYIETFDTVVRQDGDASGRVTSGGIASIFATARIDADAQATIMSLLAAGGNASDLTLGRAEFNVLLGLVGLAQEGDIISLDGVDERRSNLPRPKLAGLTAEPVIPPITELAAKPPQTPVPAAAIDAAPEIPEQHRILRPAMDDPEDDPWNTPDMHKGHAHTKQNGIGGAVSNGQTAFGTSPTAAPAPHTPSETYSARTRHNTSSGPRPNSGIAGPDGWGAGFYAPQTPAAGPSTSNPFGGDGAVRTPDAPGPVPPSLNPSHSAAGRTGSSVEENVIVTLMPGKEGVFMFQHHNYEVTSQRRGSKVIRRYSDFVWLLDCLHKRYPFRVLPLLPPKRVAVNGNHLSNDGAFIEKRRRGLSRFINALVRHPILSQEQLVVMFLTVPTELAVWRKQSTISVQDEFTDRALPPGLEDSLPPTLEELFTKTRSGVVRSAELYINVCNIMDRLVKRTEGVAADHARVAMSLASLTETSADTYATDTNEVPLLNDGLTAMSRHLRTCQSLLEDESKGWDVGVLEDLKRQRDALVSVRELFERRDRLDKDNIPYLERRIQTNETKLATLRGKPEGTVKPGEIEKVADNIIKDKESIVQQHNRSVFVKECIRDELISFQLTQYHISRWNQDWAGERVKYAEMLAGNWRALLEQLEGMPLGP
ncbi:sorting nexin Mvp1 [Cordyceps fumosorosea ARSEF 2679]|uniref:Sorting nexin MVP1 n=1 Tax=Cordyceps fumosorosea (strain ARSEF 2679) TaxID=1081104 RepID=A0A167LJL7_CORFA|nr:sorting nexin Mvp1 [Cordyceps fumosorosea ARSEF 2679]OAA53162.1 sorting nexin Mvp1 [Cordyceps fumosorosea ARSEF 2679]